MSFIFFCSFSGWFITNSAHKTCRAKFGFIGSPSTEKFEIQHWTTKLRTLTDVYVYFCQEEKSIVWNYISSDYRIKKNQSNARWPGKKFPFQYSLDRENSVNCEMKNVQWHSRKRRFGDIVPSCWDIELIHLVHMVRSMCFCENVLICWYNVQCAMSES